MAQISKDFDKLVKKSRLAKLIGNEKIFWRVPKEKQLIIESHWDEQKRRIGEIIGFDDENYLLEVNVKIYG
jgi:hypothetical protein